MHMAKYRARSYCTSQQTCSCHQMSSFFKDIHIPNERFERRTFSKKKMPKQKALATTQNFRVFNIIKKCAKITLLI
jgi:hypothetical protein